MMNESKQARLRNKENGGTEDDRDLRLLRRYLRVAPLSRALIRSREIALIEEHLSTRDRILDIGHGDGHFAAVLEEEGIRLFVGLDRSFDELRRARGRTGTHLVVGEIEDAPFRKGVFEAAISNCVLEHVDRIETAFEETARVLKPGGEFLATVVSDHYEKLLFWPRLLEKIGWNRWRERYLVFLRHRFQHCRYLAPEEWLRIAASAGFREEKTEHYIGPWRQRLMDLCLPFIQLARILRFFTGTEVLLPVRWPAAMIARRLERDDETARSGWAANTLLVLRKQR
jgi:ubiquinone/menaquinone biosynthesis C-methylase UbiE